MYCIDSIIRQIPGNWNNVRFSEGECVFYIKWSENVCLASHFNPTKHHITYLEFGQLTKLGANSIDYWDEWHFDFFVCSCLDTYKMRKSLQCDRSGMLFKLFDFNSLSINRKSRIRTRWYEGGQHIRTCRVMPTRLYDVQRKKKTDVTCRESAKEKHTNRFRQWRWCQQWK